MAEGKSGDGGDLRRRADAGFGGSDHGVIAECDCVVRAERFVRCAYELAGKRQEHEHRLAVGDLLATLGCSDSVVAAGILHEVLADTSVAPAEIVAAFGDDVAGFVGALTEDRSIDDDRERMRALRASVQRSGRACSLIFAADTLVRLRTADEAGVMIEALQLEHYQRSFEMLVAGGVRSEQVEELGWRLRLRRAGGARANESQAAQRRRVPCFDGPPW